MPFAGLSCLSRFPLRHVAWMVCAVVALGAVLGVSISQAEEPIVFRYMSVRGCRGCHNRESPNPKLRVFHSWEDSAHARAWTDLPAEDRDNPACLRCHTTGFGMPRRAGTTDEDLRGVQCEACHGPGTHYFTWNVMKNRELAMSRGMLLPTREVCAKCHW